MTTIATRGDGIVAADSQCTWGDNKLRVRKVFRLPCGGLAAGCGVFSEIVAAIDWVKTRKGKPPKMKNCDLMVVYADRTLTLAPGGIFTEVMGPIAIGSGMQAALCAMRHFEASAEEAVHAAASVDPSTSAPVEVYRVKPKRVRKTR